MYIILKYIPVININKIYGIYLKYIKKKWCIIFDGMVLLVGKARCVVTCLITDAPFVMVFFI